MTTPSGAVALPNVKPADNHLKKYQSSQAYPQFVMHYTLPQPHLYRENVTGEQRGHRSMAQMPVTGIRQDCVVNVGFDSPGFCCEDEKGLKGRKSI